MAYILRKSLAFCSGCNTVYFDSLMFPLLYFREKMPPRPQGRRPEPENNGVSLSTVNTTVQQGGNLQGFH